MFGEMIQLEHIFQMSWNHQLYGETLIVFFGLHRWGFLGMKKTHKYLGRFESMEKHHHLVATKKKRPVF